MKKLNNRGRKNRIIIELRRVIQVQRDMIYKRKGEIKEICTMFNYKPSTLYQQLKSYIMVHNDLKENYSKLKIKHRELSLLEVNSQIVGRAAAGLKTLIPDIIPTSSAISGNNEIYYGESASDLEVVKAIQDLLDIKDKHYKLIHALPKSVDAKDYL